MQVSYRIEIALEGDGRFLAEVQELPGVMAYGRTAEDAIAHVQALALRVRSALHELDSLPTISEHGFVTVRASET
jgi:predicted RNase H-like HicB family nuclease